MNTDFFDAQTAAAVIFVIFMAVFLWIKRKDLKMEKILYPVIYIVMHRTKVGLKLMDRISKKWKKAVSYFGYIGIVVGFIGMAIIVFFLIRNLVYLITVPAAKSTVGLVLPFKVKGALFVPFFYWIICIFILAAVHEFAHGVVARRYAVRIKSSGLAVLAVLLPVIPAAFVEPDEKQLQKKKKSEQLSVFAAGPFANIILAGIVLLISFLLFAPIVSSMMQSNGVVVSGLIKSNNITYPAELAGMKQGELITTVDGTQIETLENFTLVMEGKKPGDMIVVGTNISQYKMVLSSSPDSKEKPYLGVYVAESAKINPEFEQKYGNYLAPVIMWIVGLFYWLFVLNLGIGLFNLVPLGPVDGGRMLLTSLEAVCKDKKGKEDKKKAALLWKMISIFFLALVLANIAFAFIR